MRQADVTFIESEEDGIDAYFRGRRIAHIYADREWYVLTHFAYGPMKSTFGSEADARSWIETNREHLWNKAV